MNNAVGKNHMLGYSLALQALHNGGVITSSHPAGDGFYWVAAMAEVIKFMLQMALGLQTIAHSECVKDGSL